MIFLGERKASGSCQSRFALQSWVGHILALQAMLCHRAPEACQLAWGRACITAQHPISEYVASMAWKCARHACHGPACMLSAHMLESCSLVWFRCSATAHAHTKTTQSLHCA